MAKKVTVNGNCIGCGACTGICPEVFDLNGDGQAENILGSENELPEDLEAGVAEAAEACPVEAIEVE